MPLRVCARVCMCERLYVHSVFWVYLHSLHF